MFRFYQKTIRYKWWVSTRFLAFLFEQFKKLDDCSKPIAELRKKDIFSKLTGKDPSAEEFTITKTYLKILIIKTGNDLVSVCCKPDTLFLAHTLLIFIDTIKIYGLDLFCFVFLSGYTYQSTFCGSKEKVEFIRDIEFLLFIESGLPGGLSWVSEPNFFNTGDGRGMEHIGVTGMFGLGVTQTFAFTKLDFETTTSLESILQAPGDFEAGINQK